MFTASNFRKFYKPWEEKVNTAFFRGSATGGGTTIDTNQRLHLAHLSNTWKNDPKLNGEEAGDDVPFLNAEVTTWNLRDKKIAGTPMTFLRHESFIFKAGREHFIPIYEQTTFKYILYVEGHCAANRYAFLMRLGGVILKVTSRCVADEMWYYPLLKPYEDHVPVKEDLSDLAEQIQWCRDNDDKCQQIAARANELYDRYVSKEAIHDYMEVICNRVAKRFQPAPKWFHRPTEADSERKPRTAPPRSMCVSGSDARHCKRCVELKEQDDSHHSIHRSHQRARADSGGNYYGGSRRDRSDSRDHHYDNNSSSYNGGGNNRGRSRDRYSSRDGGGGSSSSRDRYRDNSNSSYSRNRSNSPKRNKPPVPQCRKCRRAKAACSCSYRQ